MPTKKKKKKTYIHKSVRVDAKGEYHVTLTTGHSTPDTAYQAYKKKSLAFRNKMIKAGKMTKKGNWVFKKKAK